MSPFSQTYGEVAFCATSLANACSGTNPMNLPPASPQTNSGRCLNVDEPSPLRAPVPARSVSAPGCSAPRADGGRRRAPVTVLLSALFAVAVLVGCSGSDGSNGADGRPGVDGAAGAAGLNALVLTSAEPAGSRCAAGGVRIDAGLDTNRNGTLEAAEIATTQYVCGSGAGTDGLSTLVLMQDEPAGANCPSGGKRISAGLDADRNGVLAVGEVSATAYVCNGANGSTGAAGADGKASLISTSAEPAGANCATGGLKINAGIDANGNGVLDVAEVSSTNYVCNGTNGAAGSNGRNSLIATTTEPAGANCANGGLRIATGLDANGNGVLDAAEVASTAYACNGLNGAQGPQGPQGPTGPSGPTGPTGLSTLGQIVPEPAGANCPYGGIKITGGLDTNRNGVLDPSEVTATSYVCNGAPAGLSWQNVTGTAVTAQPNKGYLANNATARVTVTLPQTSELALGDIVAVTGVGAGGWKIAQNAGQTISGTALGVPAGARWTARESARFWQAIASSADGNKLVAVVRGGQIYTSTDSGVTWTARETNRNWFAVASSADGSKLVASAEGGSTHPPTVGRHGHQACPSDSRAALRPRRTVASW